MLSHAAERGHEAVVRVLLDSSRVNPNIPSCFGWTPLRYAAERGREGTVSLLLKTGKVKVTGGVGWSPNALALIENQKRNLARGVQCNYYCAD